LQIFLKLAPEGLKQLKIFAGALELPF